ncbi:MAG: enoyl-CoA hydratase/isomerase family protein [Propionibacteriaceae bacterium]|jgi:enoyl-CoA hydratase|nr:enoyl-CoA hydratase/isomerase family protein [Propionibacteriaceae bacterium]
MSLVEARVENGAGHLLLNRPAAINALSSAMIDQLYATLVDWAEDPAVREVVIAGAGRGFCAGADVRELRQVIIEERGDPVDFLAREYRLDALVATYPKPYTARLHGIVMGGGMGVSIHGSHRVAALGTTLAMPEVTIGLWPDVGMMYHLARLPGEAGTYMALTGLTVTGAEAGRLGLVNIVETADEPGQTGLPGPGGLAEAFAGDDILAIMDRLEASSDPAARHAAATIRLRSPLSVAVSLEALRRARHLSQAAVFDQDLRMGAFFLGEPADYVEGVRAQLVDKDFTPRWRYPRLEDVPAAAVRAAFD